MTHKLFALTVVVLPLIALPMSAQVDFSGNWAPVFHEDYPERVPGPELGDYAGIPLNAAGRLRADSYDADRISIVTEYQCRPHGGDYSMRGLSNMRIVQEIDPLSQRVIALHTRMGFQEMERTIYMDGRPRPGPDAPHTWQGFSLGSFDQNMLNVYTTHQKASYIRRNGIPRSADGTFTEHWTRHGNYLTVTTVITDPAFLTEPLTRSQTWVLDPNQQMTRDVCDYAPEVPNSKGADNVPNHLPGANPFLHEVADWYGLPFEATRGGPETMYPEYRQRMGKPDKPVPLKCDRYCHCGENNGPCNLK